MPVVVVSLFTLLLAIRYRTSGPIVGVQHANSEHTKTGCRVKPYLGATGSNVHEVRGTMAASTTSHQTAPIASAATWALRRSRWP